MTKQTFTTKSNGDTLSASEWNSLTSYVNTAVDAINNASTNTGGSGDGIISAVDETATGGDATVGIYAASGVEAIGSPKIIELTKKKKGVNTTIYSGNNINLEPRESVGETKGGNISLKPGDDIELCSHHRLSGNQDEVSVKVIDGSDIPVKLQLNAAEMTITTKGKTGDNNEVFDLTVNSAKNTRGYLKVRAQAIDLRSESHGGIAIQPKGRDSEGHMNKIKFEHGGGDGLEFGTFNTEKASIFTDEYRFNKNGIWKMATRDKQVSNKANDADDTTSYKYVKQADDFYDKIANTDPQTTTQAIITTASAFNGQFANARTVKEKGLIITTKALYLCNGTVSAHTDNKLEGDANTNMEGFTTGTYYTEYDICEALGALNGDNELVDSFSGLSDANSNYASFDPTQAFTVGYDTIIKFTPVPSAIEFDSNTIVVNPTTTLSIGTSSCAVADIISFVNWAKTRNQGPWSN